jgi:hypothetical protein
MQEGPSAIGEILKECESQLLFVTPAECAGRWMQAFGEAAERIPEPYWLFTADEMHQIALGYPIRVSTGWAKFLRDIGRLIDAEAVYRRTVALGQSYAKGPLVDLRRQFVQRTAELIENAVLHDYGQRLPEIFWLTVSNEMAERVNAAIRALAQEAPQLTAKALDEIRYSIADRLIDVAQRAETDAMAYLRQHEGIELSPASRAFSRLLRDDVMPFADVALSPDYRQVNSFLQGHLRIDASRFHKVVRATGEKLQALRTNDPVFARVLGHLDPEVLTLPPERLPFVKSVLDILDVWQHPETPKLSSDMRALCADLALRCKRFEIVTTLRRRLVPIEEKGHRTFAQSRGQAIELSGSTRPMDFAALGVTPSMVRRYGLVYDLVEFTQLLEELRRRGRLTEESALRQMVSFLGNVEQIRVRHRLKFEKFLGDGAFYSGRSARALLFAAAELRLVYEEFRRDGFPFDRGLRLAINVGSYHLLPMVAPTSDEPSFEFFGHGLVELVRLTTGKRTHEVEDIADFLIAAGYDVHRVLDFLEPVRHASRVPDSVRERPYAAYLAENGELVNLGGIATETFLHDLEEEWDERETYEGHAFGFRWLLLPGDDTCGRPLYVGLRFLGTAKLKGLDPAPLTEVAVFPELPSAAILLPKGKSLVATAQRLAGHEVEAGDAEHEAEEVDPKLCVVGVLDDAGAHSWTIGLYQDDNDVLDHAFRVPLTTVGLKDGEPFEAWLFGRRHEIAMLYQGLRRGSHGASVPLDTLRGRDGYLSCLLIAPHRSPR